MILLDEEAPREGTHFANEGAILIADVKALKLALTIGGEADVRLRFLEFHDFATSTIRRTRVRSLERMNSDRLCEIILKWSILYRKYYEFLLARYGEILPCEQAVDLDGLGLNPKGFWCLSIASRYAEYWAESAVHHTDIFNEWAERFNFIGSDEFVKLHVLRESDEFLVYDQKGLALPSFDVLKVSSRYDGGGLWSVFSVFNSHLVRMTENSARVLSDILGSDIFHPGEVRTRRVVKVGVRTGFSAVNYVSSRVGVIGNGFVKSYGASRVYFLDELSVELSFFVLQSLRSNSEFQRVLFHNRFSDVARSVFPNQKVRKLVDSNAGEGLEFLNEISRYTGKMMNVCEYCFLDEWFFRGEDPSYRNEV